LKVRPTAPTSRCARRSPTARHRPKAIKALRRSPPSHQFSPNAVVLPNGVFSLYAALADRLSRVTAGAQLKAYILPLAEIGVRVVSDQPDRIQVGTKFLDVQRYDLLFASPGGDLAVSLTAGDGGRLIRLTIPAQAIEVVREDVASPTSRTQVFSNPGDEAVMIPAVGFNLGATITKPASAQGSGAAGPATPKGGDAGRCPPSSCWRDQTLAIATASRLVSDAPAIGGRDR
jgi:hypothetical protein